MSVPVLILVNQPVSHESEPRTDAPTPAFVQADARLPHLSVLDLGATRGDGVFETVMVAAGSAPAIDAHLDRFAESARLLDLPAPDRSVWQAAFAAAVAAHPLVDVLAVKLVLTRGIEGEDSPTGWIVARPGRDFTRERSEGVRVVTLDRGYRHDVAATSPWLLQGAKTLSYAVNTAALREAARRGADDVVFTSSDGFVLEAPTASVLLREGDRFSTPSADLGILPGTTQRRAFAFLNELGFETDSVRLRTSKLHRADSLWLVSSIRRAVPVVSLDGEPKRIDHDLTARLNAYLAEH
ncbi:aminotransferase class IV [Herbiconiux sp. P18]|uniref:aminotransferase class IV n=1 Tax=Herbiconiux liangxiaofengii TaxID=3342795 RepID=UPI0035BA49AE